MVAARSAALTASAENSVRTHVVDAAQVAMPAACHMFIRHCMRPAASSGAYAAIINAIFAFSDKAGRATSPKPTLFLANWRAR